MRANHQKLALVGVKEMKTEEEEGTALLFSASVSLQPKSCVYSALYTANCKLLKIMRTGLFTVTN